MPVKTSLCTALICLLAIGGLLPSKSNATTDDRPANRSPATEDIQAAEASNSKASSSPSSSASRRARKPKPNFIIIFTDDQGYNDLSCFGSKKIKTPNIDQLATEGRRFTSFYVPCSVCSPSRAALLTGCYPKRVSMEKHVLFPKSDYGLHPDEHTIADHLKSVGYATACVGKWHLGHHPELLPRQQGFDSYYGIPYSNDMNHPANQNKPRKMTSNELWADQASAVNAWNTPLVENEEIIELPVDQRTITRRYTDKAIEFVTANKDKPFFLYLPHSMPHIPLYVPNDVYDPNPENAYTCVIEHIDAEVGRLTQTVRDLGLSDNTYIIYTTDNGPWLQFKNHGGSADPLRSGKGTTFEGGQRVPCIMWAPGRIPAGTTTNAMASTMDLLPTIAKLAGTELPNRKIDGSDISKTLSSNETPRNELIFYSSRGDLQGLRQGDWKYLKISNTNRKTKKTNTQTYLFNLAEDIGEQVNLLEKHPEKAKQLVARMEVLDQELTANQRPVWRKPKSE
ncbi:MAG: arylsulfatase A [Mariniblastus sp.]|jgi:arylsulfatase A